MSQLQWLEYKLLKDYAHVAHATFTRHGGVSQGRFASLNLGHSTADHPAHVKENHELVRKTMGVERVIYPHLSHGVGVQRITSLSSAIPHADAIYTTVPGIGIGVTHADCQAAIFYDPVHEAIAVVHCGWRGNVQNIYARVIETLHSDLGTQAHDLLVCISPSLGPDHAEFKNYKQELPQEFWEFATKPEHFDLWAISRMQLTRAGVLPERIEFAGLCTMCETKDYFSYRVDNTGRNATVVALRADAD